MVKTFVQGWTAPIDYRLTRDRATFDATGMTVAIVATSAGVAVTLTGVVDWLDAEVSEVRYTPAADDLTSARSPLRIRFKVTNGAAISYYPAGAAETWKINETPA